MLSLTLFEMRLQTKKMVLKFAIFILPALVEKDKTSSSQFLNEAKRRRRRKKTMRWF